jgi:hypothetical protein
MRDKTEWFANNHYCSNVLLPEFLTYMYMNMFSLDREEAATRHQHQYIINILSYIEIKEIKSILNKFSFQYLHFKENW